MNHRAFKLERLVVLVEEPGPTARLLGACFGSRIRVSAMAEALGRLVAATLVLRVLTGLIMLIRVALLLLLVLLLFLGQLLLHLEVVELRFVLCVLALVAALVQRLHADATLFGIALEEDLRHDKPRERPRTFLKADARAMTCLFERLFGRAYFAGPLVGRHLVNVDLIGGAIAAPYHVESLRHLEKHKNMKKL